MYANIFQSLAAEHLNTTPAYLNSMLLLVLKQRIDGVFKGFFLPTLSLL